MADGSDREQPQDRDHGIGTGNGDDQKGQQDLDHGEGVNHALQIFQTRSLSEPRARSWCWWYYPTSKQVSVSNSSPERGNRGACFFGNGITSHSDQGQVPGLL